MRLFWTNYQPDYANRSEPIDLCPSNRKELTRHDLLHIFGAGKLDTFLVIGDLSDSVLLCFWIVSVREKVISKSAEFQNGR